MYGYYAVMLNLKYYMIWHLNLSAMRVVEVWIYQVHVNEALLKGKNLVPNIKLFKINIKKVDWTICMW